MSGHRYSGRTRTRPSSSSSRSDRSRSRSARRRNLEDMKTMLYDAYTSAAANDNVSHYAPPVGSYEPPVRHETPPPRNVFRYVHDSTRKGKQAYQLRRSLIKQEKQWKEFLELYPYTRRDDPSLSREEERRRRLQVLWDHRNL